MMCSGVFCSHVYVLRPVLPSLNTAITPFLAMQQGAKVTKSIDVKFTTGTHRKTTFSCHILLKVSTRDWKETWNYFYYAAYRKRLLITIIILN